MDYLSYWSLLRRPFALEADAAFFAGVPQREAIAGLNNFVTSGLNSAFLVAPSRCGVTWLLQHVKRMHGFGDCAAEVILTAGTQLRHEQVHEELCEALGYQNVVDDGLGHLDRAIQASAEQGVHMIWMIDRCRAAAAYVARDLIMSHSNLSVVIAATPEELGKQMVQFGRCAMRIDLSALSLEDTMGYVRYCVEQAGGSRQLFPDQTTAGLHELTGGALADLAVAAESALVLAAGQRMDQVSPAIVEAIEQQISRAA